MEHTKQATLAPPNLLLKPFKKSGVASSQGLLHLLLVLSTVDHAFRSVKSHALITSETPHFHVTSSINFMTKVLFSIESHSFVTFT